jgi:hypothetical protein
VGDRVLRGAIQPVERDGRTVNVVRELLVGRPHIATARGVVVSADAELGELTIQPDGANSTGPAPENITLFVPARQRSLLFKNGEPIASLESVVNGDIVESVSYYTANSQVVKLSVVSPTLQRVSGVVVTVAPGGLALTTPNGRIISLSVDATARITLNGRSVTTLERVQRGDVVSEAVYISRPDNRDEGAAVRLAIFNPRLLDVITSTGPGSGDGTSQDGGALPLVQTVISGVITSIEGDVWAIGGLRFRVTPATQFFGEEPRVGLVAKASLRIQSDGTLIATAISVAGDPDTNPAYRPADIVPIDPDGGEDGSDGLVRISGYVQEVVEQRAGVTVIVVDGVSITINAETAVTGEPAKGAFVTAVVSREADGAVVAVSATFTAQDAPGTEPPDNAESTPAPGNDNGGDAGEDSADEDLLAVTVEVHRIEGRLILGADGKLYLLPLDQALTLKPGDSVDLQVRRVARADLATVLGTFDIVAISNNSLYTANATSVDNALYIAE